MKILIIVFIVSASIYFPVLLGVKAWVIRNQQKIRALQIQEFMLEKKEGKSRRAEGEPLTHPFKFAPIPLRALLILSSLGMFSGFWGAVILSVYRFIF